MALWIIAIVLLAVFWRFVWVFALNMLFYGAILLAALAAIGVCVWIALTGFGLIREFFVAYPWMGMPLVYAFDAVVLPVGVFFIVYGILIKIGLVKVKAR